MKQRIFVFVLIAGGICVLLGACSSPQGLPVGAKRALDGLVSRESVGAGYKIASAEKAICPINKYRYSDYAEVWCVVTDKDLGFDYRSHFHLIKYNDGNWSAGVGFDDEQAATEFLAIGCTNYGPSAEPARTPTPVPTPTPDLSRLYVIATLSPPFSEAEEYAREQKQQLEKLEQDARKVYNADWDSYVIVEFEFENPVFRRVFPQARMYAVWIGTDLTYESNQHYTTMVLQKGKYYRMPDDFNRLMLDAGLELTSDTRFDLAQALVVANLPTRMALQPVACSGGRKIDEEISGVHLTYTIDCQFEYGHTDTVVKLGSKETDYGLQFIYGWTMAGTTELSEWERGYAGQIIIHVVTQEDK